MDAALREFVLSEEVRMSAESITTIVGIVVLLLALASGFGWMIHRMDGRLTETRTDLSGQISDLRTELRGEIADVRQDVSEVQRGLNAVQVSVARLEVSVAGLEASVARLEGPPRRH